MQLAVPVRLFAARPFKNHRLVIYLSVVGATVVQYTQVIKVTALYLSYGAVKRDVSDLPTELSAKKCHKITRSVSCSADKFVRYVFPYSVKGILF